MCGLIGSFGGAVGSRKEAFARGLRALHHRGPESHAQYDDAHVLLGHTRLKIIDLSDSSNQPFVDERFVLIFNGEIYNYLELKTQEGYVTRTTGDTEVLFEHLKRYRNDPARALSALNGMFAFAFYDKRDHTVLLARDRLGVKPLHYAETNDGFHFASEIKALQPLLPPLRVRHEAAIGFLLDRTLSYGRETFFENVFQLPPGSFAELRPQGGRVTAEPKAFREVDRLPTRPPDRLAGSDEQAVRHFRELFLDAVGVRLRSDVPIAILLSGGLDSGAIAGAVSKLSPKSDVTCITAVYPGDPKDERKYAEAVIQKHPNLRPHWVEIEETESMAKLMDVIRTQETPIADGSMVAHYLLMRRIHELGVKVVLTGQGGDEILAGYVHSYRPALLADEIRQGKPHLGRALFHALPASIKNSIRRLWQKQTHRAFFRDPEIFDRIDAFYRHWPDRSLLKSYLIQSVRYWSLPGFLHYDDRNSMRFSIETRGPFLDYRLVEYLLSLPNRLLYRDGLSKWILRQALGDLMPPTVLWRRDKQGFHAPIDRWARVLGDEIQDDRDFAQEFPYLNLSQLETNWMFRWRVNALWIWYREFIANRVDVRQSIPAKSAS